MWKVKPRMRAQGFGAREARFLPPPDRGFLLTPFTFVGDFATSLDSGAVTVYDQSSEWSTRLCLADHKNYPSNLVSIYPPVCSLAVFKNFIIYMPWFIHSLLALLRYTNHCRTIQFHRLFRIASDHWVTPSEQDQGTISTYRYLASSCEGNP